MSLFKYKSYCRHKHIPLPTTNKRSRFDIKGNNLALMNCTVHTQGTSIVAGNCPNKGFCIVLPNLVLHNSREEQENILPSDKFPVRQQIQL